MNFDELREYFYESVATPESGAATLAIESAIYHTRGVSGTGESATRCGKRTAREVAEQSVVESKCLSDWALENGVSTEFRTQETYGPCWGEGNEHLVWLHEDKDRVRRLSLDRIDLFSHGAFGQTVEAFDDTDLDGSEIVLIENRKATPSEYLERLFLQNILFNVDNRLVAISEYGIETTQPYFRGKPAKHSSIASKFDEFGFEPHGALTWVSRALEIAISDVAIRNLVEVDDAIFPFDIWARRIRLGEKLKQIPAASRLNN